MNRQSWLKRLIDRFNKKDQSSQPSSAPAFVEPLPVEPSPSVTSEQLSPFEQELANDWERYRSVLGQWDKAGRDVRDDLKKKYSKHGLALLIDTLSAKPGATTQKQAEENIEHACKVVSERYPLDWMLPKNAATMKMYGSTMRYMLNSHHLLVNDNGAYSITDLRADHREIFSKPAADNSAFVMPQGYPPPPPQ